MGQLISCCLKKTFPRTVDLFEKKEFGFWAQSHTESQSQRGVSRWNPTPTSRWFNCEKRGRGDLTVKYERQQWIFVTAHGKIIWMFTQSLWFSVETPHVMTRDQSIPSGSIHLYSQVMLWRKSQINFDIANFIFGECLSHNSQSTQSRARNDKYI